MSCTLEPQTQKKYPELHVYSISYLSLIASANSLKPDQARQNVGPDCDLT